MIKQSLFLMAGLFITISLLMYFFQRHLIYVPNINKPSRSVAKASDMEEISLITKDNLSLNAWYKPAKPHQATILFLHGNAGNIASRMSIIRPLLNAGLGVLLLDYRGYGGNKGQPNEQGLYEDARTGMRFLQSQGLSSQQSVIYGESIGTGVATQMAVEYPACAVVLQSPFTSLKAAARYHYPWLLLEPWDRYDSLARIQSMHEPLLILHGRQDDVVPYAQGLSLFKAANEPKLMISFATGTHNNLWRSQKFYEKTLQFIRANCL